MTVSHEQHKTHAQEQLPDPVRCGIITVSDSRTAEIDTSGKLVRSLLEQAGHIVMRLAIVPDDTAAITAQLQALIAEGCQVVVTNGGTGIARRDVTFEAVDGLLEKRLPGFGELFRLLSYQEIGTPAMLSRATAGTYRQTLIFCLPGSSGAVRLAMEQLILPELLHLVWELQR
jgi:molybdenum cofactor biosynthesis protein B